MASIKHNGLNQSAPRILPAAAAAAADSPPPAAPAVPASNELMLKYAEAQ